MPTTHPPSEPPATPTETGDSPVIPPNPKLVEMAHRIETMMTQFGKQMDFLSEKASLLSATPNDEPGSKNQEIKVVAEIKKLKDDFAAFQTAEVAKFHETVNTQQKKEEKAKEVKTFDRSIGTIGIGTIGAAAANAGSISSIPLLDKIPYLAEAAKAIQAGLFSLADTLGLGTGANATHAALANLWPSVGPAAVGAVGIPFGLWGIGKMKQWLVGRKTPEKYTGILKPIKEAAKIPVELVAMPFKLLHKTVMEGPKYVSDTIKGWYGSTKTFLKENMWDPVIAPIIKPTGLGIGGATLGAILALQAGTPLSPAILAGYGIFNYLKNKKYFGNGDGASPAAKPNP